MDIEKLKNLFRHYGMKPNFTYGQNFLIDDIVLQDIVDAAEITETDAVLEIGPGIGNLTKLLCERAGFVLSVEKDPKFFPILKAIRKDYKDKFRFEIADALEYDYQSVFLPELAFGQKQIGHKIYPSTSSGNKFYGYKVVANIPYYITGKILQMLLSAKIKPSSITILTQKEVAQNIVAEVGDLSVLAISVQLFGQPKIIGKVLAKSFFPAPKVDSAILQIIPYENPKYKLTDEKAFFKVVKACFAGKRKQIHNTLKNNLGLEKDQASKILLDLKINPAARPQELSMEQWIELSKKV